MSRSRNLSEFDIRPNSSYKQKSRQQINYQRGILQPKINHSPYTKIPIITKTRSISTIKAKPLKNRSNSPKLTKNTSSNSSLLNLNSHELLANYSQRSINESYRQHYKDHPPKLNPSYRGSGLPESLELEERLKAISKQPLSEGIKEYHKLFEEIIEKDVKYGKVLKKIKEAIDEWTKLREKLIENAESLKKQLTESSRKLGVMADDRKFLDRRMQQITQENLELVKSLDDAEANYEILERKLIKITDFTLENLNPSQDTWKALVLENKSYTELFKKMKDDLRNFRDKENKLLKLVVAMKNRGYPVEEIYNQDVYGQVETEGLGSESDRILSGRAPEAVRPEIVPVLRIEKVEPDIFTGSSYSSSIQPTP